MIKKCIGMNVKREKKSTFVDSIPRSVDCLLYYFVLEIE